MAVPVFQYFSRTVCRLPFRSDSTLNRVGTFQLSERIIALDSCQSAKALIEHAETCDRSLDGFIPRMMTSFYHALR
jgi:hypothetical protein